MSAWQVLSPGVQTTVQDQGRHGWRHLGVARAGAMDPAALAMANRLVGNDEAAAGLEIALQGPRLRLPCACRIALTVRRRNCHSRSSRNDSRASACQWFSTVRSLICFANESSSSICCSARCISATLRTGMSTSSAASMMPRPVYSTLTAAT